uniref:olfactory receptor 6F1 isoform X2 n=1 Tax=Arvicanthis niloticus TaxID=61156 RepID=UPI00402BB206
MITENGTVTQDFFLLGFPGSQVLQFSLFLFFLVMYLLTLGGNVAILLLAIMNSLLSAQLALSSWICGFLAISVPAALISTLSFCGTHAINHFFCDIAPWIALACTSTQGVETVAFVIAFVVILSSCLITLISYTYIIRTILRIPSASGRRKAFSTCSSHLTVVLIWYGSTIFLHVRTSIKDDLQLTKAVHVLNTVVTPALNPFIYTLRNKEVREILGKKWKRM